jgi:hypothetical protein
MTRAAPILLIAMIASLIPVAAQADVYRCTVNGQIQYADRPCEGGEKVAKSQPDNSNRKSQDKSPDIPSAGNRAAVAEDRRAKAEARKQEVDAAIAKREADELWKRRNMSVSCFTEKYNIWVSGRNPRPTREEANGKWTKWCANVAIYIEYLRTCLPEEARAHGSSRRHERVGAGDSYEDRLTSNSATP